MEISEQLKSIRKEKCLTQQELANQLEVSTATIASVENGSRDMPKALMKSLVKKFGIDANWLLTGEGEMFKQGKEAESAVAVSTPKIPILRQKVSCGPGQSWESEDNIESYIEPLSPLPCLSGRNVYAFRASGVSMIGLGIQDGDVVFFDGSSDQRTRDGIYVFGFAGYAYCKLLRFEPLENKVMVYSVQKPDLREAELVRTIDADSNEFHIFGRVLAWLHENTVFRT